MRKHISPLALETDLQKAFQVQVLQSGAELLVSLQNLLKEPRKKGSEVFSKELGREQLALLRRQ